MVLLLLSWATGGSEGSSHRRAATAGGAAANPPLEPRFINPVSIVPLAPEGAVGIEIAFCVGSRHHADDPEIVRLAARLVKDLEAGVPLIRKYLVRHWMRTDGPLASPRESE
jgi:hypothetical protein